MLVAWLLGGCVFVTPFCPLQGFSCWQLQIWLQGCSLFWACEAARIRLADEIIIYSQAQYKAAASLGYRCSLECCVCPSSAGLFSFAGANAAHLLSWLEVKAQQTTCCLRSG